MMTRVHHLPSGADSGHRRLLERIIYYNNLNNSGPLLAVSSVQRLIRMNHRRTKQCPTSPIFCTYCIQSHTHTLYENSSIIEMGIVYQVNLNYLSSRRSPAIPHSLGLWSVGHQPPGQQQPILSTHSVRTMDKGEQIRIIISNPLPSTLNRSSSKRGRGERRKLRDYNRRRRHCWWRPSSPDDYNWNRKENSKISRSA